MKNLALARDIRAVLNDGVGIRLINNIPIKIMYPAINRPGNIGSFAMVKERNIGNITNIAPAGAGTPTKLPLCCVCASALLFTLKRAKRSTQQITKMRTAIQPSLGIA